MRTFVAGNRAHARHSDSTLSHRAHLTASLAAEWGPQDALSIPVRVGVLFTFSRPKSHYGTGRNADVLKPSAPLSHIQPPDIDKLARLVLDSLEMSGILGNDSHVCALHAHKFWGRVDTTQIIVWRGPE